MKPPKMLINVTARKVEVDNRIPLRYYYRIADNLLRQASIYREEKNVVDLYVMLLRFSSLVSETIPFHRDYQVLLPKERTSYRKKLLVVLDELESLKPEFQRQVNELNKHHAEARTCQIDGLELERISSGSGTSSVEWPPNNKRPFLGLDVNWPVSRAPQYSSKNSNGPTQTLSSNSMDIDKQFQKLSLSLPLPKKETLSRHSFLGPNGLRGQWLGPSAEIKVHYPSSTDLIATENSSLNQAGQYGLVAEKEDNSGGDRSTMESVLSLDDGRWLCPADESVPPVNNEVREGNFQLGTVRQPSPPPVLAQLQPDFLPISPSKVADPRPGPAKSSQDGVANSNPYQHLHIPVKMMDDFLRLARENTTRNLETCGVLAGSLKNRVFHITTLIVPKQESTSDSCQTLNEEEIFEVQDKFSLFPLGWIHTHPSQTCFMSSVDLHTHYSYQIMLPEAIAIVMAPTDTTSPHGIFHLSDPGGVSIIRNCQQRGFHPHEEPLDGTPIYEHCSHVYMNPKLKFEVVDLR
ncbi:AMSH-like ubiquitin thioesterase 3 [Malania oleifera]|uniref:AMSH-like ubiquitin thioesterase 3 n=1 Tax=Malania oleifera TaxID=397392 RepID=UPI0025AE9E81|nr:AMSH-like ubiquitin thioesterase 3 [Malania oleifera]